MSGAKQPCKNCGRVMPIVGKGLCGACYVAQHKAAKAGPKAQEAALKEARERLKPKDRPDQDAAPATAAAETTKAPGRSSPGKRVLAQVDRVAAEHPILEKDHEDHEKLPHEKPPVVVMIHFEGPDAGLWARFVAMSARLRRTPQNQLYHIMEQFLNHVERRERMEGLP